MYRYTAHPGFLGQAVAKRRRGLGLSRDEVAARAGLAVSYLAYVEGNPAMVTYECLLRLADALDTTTDALLGAEPASWANDLTVTTAQLPDC